MDSSTARETAVRLGYAARGTLVVDRRDKMFRVESARRLKYVASDEDGKQWLVRFESVKPAPEGAVFGGPEMKNPAGEFSIGDVVQMNNARGQAKFPGTFVLVRRTTADRFKLQGIGTSVSLTAPAALLEKVSS